MPLGAVVLTSLHLVYCSSHQELRPQERFAAFEMIERFKAERDPLLKRHDLRPIKEDGIAAYLRKLVPLSALAENAKRLTPMLGGACSRCLEA